MSVFFSLPAASPTLIARKNPAAGHFFDIHLDKKIEFLFFLACSKASALSILIITAQSKSLIKIEVD